MSKFRNLSRFFITAFLISLWIISLLLQKTGDGLETDFYPIYRAGQTLLAGQSPYSQTEIDHYKQVWEVPFAAAGFAYPLPIVVGILPLLLLPLKAAAFIWVAFGIVGAVAAIRLRPDWQPILLLPFLFLPLHRAATFRQATLIWVAMIPVLVWAMRTRKSWLVGWCIVMLPAKPQVGLLFSLAGLYWALRENRFTLIWAAGWGFLILGGSFLLDPTWLSGWMKNLQLYNEVVTPVSFLPWSLVLIVVTWKLPWYARLAAAQVALFPASDVYSALPLLLSWVGIGGRLALLGSALSWVWLFASLPSTALIFWILILTPLIVASLFRIYLQRSNHRNKSRIFRDRDDTGQSAE
jgi:hypothetical protein